MRLCQKGTVCFSSRVLTNEIGFVGVTFVRIERSSGVFIPESIHYLMTFHSFETTLLKKKSDAASMYHMKRSFGQPKACARRLP